MCEVLLPINMSSLSVVEALLAIASATLLLAVAFLVEKLRRRLNIVSKLSSSYCPLPPGNVWFPIVGETVEFLRFYKANKVGDFVEARRRKHGHVFRTSLFTEPTIVMDGPEVSRFLCTNEGQLVRACYPGTSPVKLFGKRNISTQFGAQHKHLRRLVMSAVRPNLLKAFVPKLEALTKKHFSRFWTGKDQVALYVLSRSHTLSSTTNLLMGVELDEIIEGEIGRLLHLFASGLSALPIYLPWTAYYKAFVAKAGLEKILSMIISERQKELRQLEENHGNLFSKDLFSSFISCGTDEDGNPFTKQEILDTVSTILSGAVDTTGNVIAFTIKFMLQNPTCYEEVLKEQMGIAEAKVQNGEEVLGWEDFTKMKYTWASVQETMRLIPQVTVWFKMVMEDFEYEGFRVPRGWRIFHNIAHGCANENYFPNPKVFDPSRFMDGKTPTPYSFLPFGAGPHMCPGSDFARMVILVFIHHLVRMFKLTLVDPMEPILMDPLPSPANGLPMRIEARS